MTSICKACAGALAAVLFASTAFAADAPVFDAPMVAPPRVLYDWTGIYGGVHAGYFWDELDIDVVPAIGAEALEPEGFIGGVQIGANWQIDQFVLGLEGDLTWSDVDDEVLVPTIPVALTTDIDWFATIRGRAGVAIDRFLIYATAGAAFADLEVGLAGLSDDDTLTGWTVGGGVEGFITQDLSVKIEYLYLDLDDEQFTMPGATVNADFTGNMVRAGLNYRFNLF